jgi:hypothetical protein
MDRFMGIIEREKPGGRCYRLLDSLILDLRLEMLLQRSDAERPYLLSPLGYPPVERLLIEHDAV